MEKKQNIKSRLKYKKNQVFIFVGKIFESGIDKDLKEMIPESINN